MPKAIILSRRCYSVTHNAQLQRHKHTNVYNAPHSCSYQLVGETHCSLCATSFSA